MANSSFTPLVPGLWETGPYQLVSEPSISSCWSSRQGLSEEPRRRTMEESLRSIEGTLLELDHKMDILEEWVRSRNEVHVRSYTSVMEPPPPPPPPAPDPYGGYPLLMTASSFSGQYPQQYGVQSLQSSPSSYLQQQWSTTYPSYQQEYEAQPSSPSTMCNPQPSPYPVLPPSTFLQQQQQQYQQYPTPLQPYANSSSLTWNQQLSPYSSPLPQYTTHSSPLSWYHQPPQIPPRHQQYQIAPYVFDEMAVRVETPNKEPETEIRGGFYSQMQSKFPSPLSQIPIVQVQQPMHHDFSHSQAHGHVHPSPMQQQEQFVSHVFDDMSLREEKAASELKEKLILEQKIKAMESEDLEEAKRTHADVTSEPEIHKHDLEICFNMDASTGYVLKLRHEIEKQCAQAFPAPVDREKVKSCLTELGEMNTGFKELLIGVMELLVEIVTPHNRPVLDSVATISFELSDAEYEENKVNDPWVQKLLHAVETNMSWLRLSMTSNNYDLFVHLVIDFIVKRLEVIMMQKSFSQLSGLQLDREVRALVSHFSEMSQRPMRDKFVRLSQMTTILNFERVSEILGFWGEKAGLHTKGLGENCKWLDMCEDVRMIILCFSLGDYDEYFEDTTMNKMMESKRLFETIVTHETFDRVDFHLILMIDAASAFGVDVLRLQGAWMMPFAYCTREKRWREFVGPVDGESTQFLQDLARKYNKDLVKGKDTQMPFFDFQEKRRIGAKQVKVSSAGVVIVDGAYALHSTLRSLLDIRVAVVGGVHFSLLSKVRHDIVESSSLDYLIDSIFIV